MVGVAVNVTLVPAQLGFVPVVCDIVTEAVTVATASVMVTAVAAWEASPELPLLKLTAFITPYILIDPVPAAGAVQGIDSTYVVPVEPVPLVAVIAEECSMVLREPVVLFCTLVGSAPPQTPACTALDVPALVDLTVDSWNPK